MQYAVWKDEKYLFCYGTIKEAEGKEIVAVCDNYELARITWKMYYYNP